MNAARKDSRREHAGPEKPARESSDPETTDDMPWDPVAGDAPPHALWQQLDEWVSDKKPREASPPKLPVAARLAIILVLSIVCWLAILGVISVL